jgi:N-acetylmuramoyl-L-alanine amidase
MPQEWLSNIKNFLTLDENKILATVLYGEARGEGWEGIIAVLNVIRNRVLRYPIYSDIAIEPYGKYMSVILKKYQFSCFLLGDPNRHKLESIAKNFMDYVEYEKQINKIYFLCTIKEYLKDNTGGATHYFADYINPPDWSKQMAQLGKIGHHIFFRED